MTARVRPVPRSPRSWRQALYLAGAIPAQLLGVAIVLACDPWITWQYHPVKWNHRALIPLWWPARYGTLWPLWAVGLALVFVMATVIGNGRRTSVSPRYGSCRPTAAA